MSKGDFEIVRSDAPSMHPTLRKRNRGDEMTKRLSDFMLRARGFDKQPAMIRPYKEDLAFLREFMHKNRLNWAQMFRLFRLMIQELLAE